MSYPNDMFLMKKIHLSTAMSMMEPGMPVIVASLTAMAETRDLPAIVTSPGEKSAVTTSPQLPL
jgi:hypothetical protein